MLTIKKFVFNPIQENTYVIHDDTKEAVIIDCGAFYHEERMALKNYMTENDLQLKHLLCTHGHLDHCFGNIFIWQEYGLKAEVMEEDEFLIAHLDEQARSFFGFELQDEVPPVSLIRHQTSDIKHQTSNSITFGTHQLSIIPTPGHTPGSVFFYCKEEATAFSGDTLFNMSIGRTDFERGSYHDILNSLQIIKNTLPPETALCCGHGPQTTMQQELDANIYLR